MKKKKILCFLRKTAAGNQSQAAAAAINDGGEPQPLTCNFQHATHSDLLGPIPDPLPPTPCPFDVPCSAFHVQIPYYPSYPCASVASVSSCSSSKQLKSTHPCKNANQIPADAGQKTNHRHSRWLFGIWSFSGVWMFRPPPLPGYANLCQLPLPPPMFSSSASPLARPPAAP